MDEKLLSSLGLNVKEIRIFKAILKLRELSPAAISKSVGIKRTTCYSLARGLVEKGFLVEHSSKRPRTFSIAPARHLDVALESEKKQLAAREKALKRFTSELSRATADESYPVPQIRFVEEQKMEQFLNSQSFKWDESMLKSDATFWGFFDPSYLEAFPRAIERYWKQAPKSITLKMFSNRSGAPLEAKIARKYPRRIIKVWDKANFDSAIWVMGEYVLIMNTRHHPFYLTEIHDATFAHDMREVFKNLWPLV